MRSIWKDVHIRKKEKKNENRRKLPSPNRWYFHRNLLGNRVELTRLLPIPFIAPYLDANKVNSLGSWQQVYYIIS